jgi:hypothetical protein
VDEPPRPAIYERQRGRDQRMVGRSEPEQADPAPPPAGEEERLDPTRYGDWEKKGMAIDF